MFKIYTYGLNIQNESKVRPIERFVEQCKWTGAKVSVLDGVFNNKQIKADSLTAQAEIKTEEYQEIIAATEIMDEEIDEVDRKKVKTREDMSAVSKYYLRKRYRFNGVIDMAFMTKYASNKTSAVFRNLTEILQKNTVGESLKHIRLYTCDGIAGTRYSRHKIANDLITVCGFTDINDTKVILRETLLANILANKARIEAQMGMICFAFPNKKQLAKWEFRPILDFLNGIFEIMYGLKISALSNSRNGRNKFKLKHHDYGVIFNKEPTEERPFVKAGWNEHPDVEDHFE